MKIWLAFLGIHSTKFRWPFLGASNTKWLSVSLGGGGANKAISAFGGDLKCPPWIRQWLWVQKLPTDIFNSDFRHSIFRRYQTEHYFEMLLKKWKSLYTPWGPSKNISNRCLNRILCLTVTKTEIIAKVVTVDEYFSRYTFHWRDHEDHSCKFSGKNLKYSRK